MNKSVFEMPQDGATDTAESMTVATPIADHLDEPLREIMGEEKFRQYDRFTVRLVAGEALNTEERTEYDALCREFFGEDFIQHLEEDNLKMRGLREEFDQLTQRHDDLMDKLMDPGTSAQEEQRPVAKEHPAVMAIGIEKFNRLRQLRERLNLVDIAESDVQEYLSLNTEWKKAFRESEYAFANTAPAEIDLESTLEIFTEEDVSKWKDGAQKFKGLLETMQAGSLQETFDEIFNPIQQNELKALFLGEKPVILFDHNIDSDEPSCTAIINILKTFGIETTVQYLYNKEQVAHTIEKNGGFFGSFGTTDPDKVMKLMDSEDGLVADKSLATGVLLGFPTDSVKRFEQAKTQPTNHKDMHFVNIYGITWADFGDNPESKIRQARLKAAFEMSGILKM